MDIEITETTFTVQVDGVGPTTCMWISGSIQPEIVKIRFYNEGNRWAQVGGYKIRKDGTQGLVWANAEFRSMWPGDWPAWLVELADRLDPAKAVDTSQS